MSINTQDRSKPRRQGYGYVRKYPFDRLAVGDSYTHECDGPSSKPGNAFRQSAYAYAKRHGLLFALKTTSAGIQVRRVK